MSQITNDELNFILVKLRESTRNKPKNIRLGQFIFNTVNHINPHIITPIIGTEEDTFYDDANITRFFEYLQKITIINNT